MDDHMLDTIWNQVELCFMLCKEEEDKGNDYKDSIDYKTASILISAYNKMVKLYYLPQYVIDFVRKNVALEYKKYKELN